MGSAKLQVMNWDDLRYLLAISRTSTLTQAANQLGVNQTTVSRRLETIEKSLGVRLFEKTPGGWIPTENGHEILEDASKMEILANQIERKVLGKDSELSGPLRITTIDCNATFNNDLFTSFSQKYPKVTLELTVSYLPQDLAKREADIALRWTKNPPEHLVGRKLTTVHYGLFVHENLIKKYGSSYQREAYPWIAWNDSMGAHITKQWMQDNLNHPHIVARFDSALALLESVKNGLGAAFIPFYYASMIPRLVCLHVAPEEFNDEIWILTHPDLRNTARVRAFVIHATDYYETRREKFEGLTQSKFSDSQKEYAFAD